MAKISIQIPVHNCVRYVVDSIQAICQNPEPDLEIMVLDDASTDGSRELLRDLKTTDKRIRLIESDENLGEAGARSEMIRKTDAVYIVIADGDDILLPGWLTPQIDLLENCPQIVATYGKMRHVDANLKDLGRIQGGSFSRFVLPFVNYVSQGGIIMRRKAVLDAGCYLETGLGNRSLGADLFLWYRLAMIGDLVFINEYRYLYRQHGDQSTKGSNSQERMRSAHQYMQDWTIEHNRSAYERIVSGTGEFSEKELRSVILLLGIIAKRMHNARMPYKQLIDAAEMIDPYDHGIISQRIVMLEQEGAFRQCLEECDKMIERFSNDLFCSMNALRIKAQLLDRIGSREEALSVKSKADLFQQQFDEFDWNQAIATTGLHVHP